MLYMVMKLNPNVDVLQGITSVYIVLTYYNLKNIFVLYSVMCVLKQKVKSAISPRKVYI